MNSPTLLMLVKVFMWVALLMPSPPHTHTRSSDSESTKSGQSVCLEDMEVEGVEAWAFFSIIKPYFRGTLCTICGLLFLKKNTIRSWHRHPASARETERDRTAVVQRATEWMKRGSSGSANKEVNQSVIFWLCCSGYVLKHKNNHVGACRTARFVWNMLRLCATTGQSCVLQTYRSGALELQRRDTLAGGSVVVKSSWEKNSERLLTLKHTYLNKNLFFFWFECIRKTTGELHIDIKTSKTHKKPAPAL